MHNVHMCMHHPCTCTHVHAPSMHTAAYTQSQIKYKKNVNITQANASSEMAPGKEGGENTFQGGYASLELRPQA